MTDQRTMRTFLDLIADHWVTGRVEHHPYRPVFQEEDICPTCTRYPGLIVNWPCDAARTPESGPLAAERPDPFHGHHPEHQSAQGTP